MSKAIIIRKSIVIAAPPEEVWDFTQDYHQRPLWDDSVKSAEIIESTPFVKVKITGRDGSSLIFEYKLSERPVRTTLSMEVESSGFFEKGGGSWTYENVNAGTRWTQINSIQLREKWWLLLMKPLIRWMLDSGTGRAMQKAKKLMEKINDER